MSIGTVDLLSAINQPVNAEELARAMGIIDGPYCMFKNITAGTSVLLLERLLDGVIFRTNNSGALATYAYRFVAGEDGGMIMAIFASSDIIRNCGNNPTPDPINIGSRVIIFEKKFRGSQTITAQICDRDNYRRLVQSLVS
jgi:hypothetical protein